jgi:GDP-L-fucose synthase
MKVLVTGGRGLVGSALNQIFPQGYYLHSGMGDLRNTSYARFIMRHVRPDVVVHLAARVGGITSNMSRQAEYYYDNVMINTNVVHEAYAAGCKRVVGLLSTCVFEDKSKEYPLTEEMLHNGVPSKTNFSYGHAKRQLAVMLASYNEQYGMQNSWIAPCNLYGEKDSYDESKSHFVAALIKKIYDVMHPNPYSQMALMPKKIKLLGDGSALRQFALAEDVAQIILRTVRQNVTENFIFATDEIYSIKRIAKIALKACDAQDVKIEFDGDESKNGQMRKDASSEKMKSLFPDFKCTTLEEGIRRMYEAYCEMQKQRK